MAFAFFIHGAPLKKYIIYVDGFNLYYRRVRHTKYKWLNLKALIKSFNFKNCEISKIRYFTSLIIPNKDLHTREKQDLYIRALQTIPEIEIHYGLFREREIKGKLLEEDNPSYKKVVRISKFEEKGSDVNIASFMLADCFQKECDVPVLLSNDSDLAERLKCIKTKLKMPVGLITPASFFVTELKSYSSFRRKISDKQLKAAQFPPKLKDEQGKFSCPKDWL